MCTNETRDEIIAEILVTHTGMPRRYAAWFVRELTETERQFVTRAAIANRKALVREIQTNVHRRRALDQRFPENIARERRPAAASETRVRRRRRRRIASGRGQGQLF